MKITANVHTNDATPIGSKVLRAASGQVVPILYLGPEVSVFVTSESIERIIEVATQLNLDMAAAAAEDAAQAAEPVAAVA